MDTFWKTLCHTPNDTSEPSPFRILQVQARNERDACEVFTPLASDGRNGTIAPIQKVPRSILYYTFNIHYSCKNTLGQILPKVFFQL